MHLSNCFRKHTFNLFTIKNKNNKHQSSLAWIQLQKRLFTKSRFHMVKKHLYIVTGGLGKNVAFKYIKRSLRKT